MRIRTTLGIGIALLSCSALLYAEPVLLGKYKGWYKVPTHNSAFNQAATVEITSAENGKLAGKFNIDGQECGGDYVMDGTYQDSKLEMRTSKGPIRGCEDVLILAIQGNKFVGTISGKKIELEKQ